MHDVIRLNVSSRFLETFVAMEKASGGSGCKTTCMRVFSTMLGRLWLGIPRKYILRVTYDHDSDLCLRLSHLPVLVSDSRTWVVVFHTVPDIG